MALSTFGIYFILYFFFLPSFDGRDATSFVISSGAMDKELEIYPPDRILVVINNICKFQESIEFSNFKFSRNFNDGISLKMIKNRNDISSLSVLLDRDILE